MGAESAALADGGMSILCRRNGFGILTAVTVGHGSLERVPWFASGQDGGQSAALGSCRSCAFRVPKSTGLVMNSMAPYSPARRRRSSSP